MTSGYGKNKKYLRVAAAILILCLLFLFAAGASYLMLRYPVRHIGLIREYSSEYGFEPAFICAVIKAESSFNDTAVSGAGASGLMQLMEDTANWIAPMAGLHDFSYEQIFIPEINIRLGCFYLRMSLDRFGDMDTALCAYNAGSSRVNEWLGDPQYSSDGITLDAIPFSETRSYVERVNRYAKVYELLLRFM